MSKRVPKEYPSTPYPKRVKFYDAYDDDDDCSQSSTPQSETIITVPQQRLQTTIVPVNDDIVDDFSDILEQPLSSQEDAIESVDDEIMTSSSSITIPLQQHECQFHFVPRLDTMITPDVLFQHVDELNHVTDKEHVILDLRHDVKLLAKDELAVNMGPYLISHLKHRMASVSDARLQQAALSPILSKLLLPPCPNIQQYTTCDYNSLRQLQAMFTSASPLPIFAAQIQPSHMALQVYWRYFFKQLTINNPTIQHLVVIGHGTHDALAQAIWQCADVCYLNGSAESQANIARLLQGEWNDLRTRLVEWQMLHHPKQLLLEDNISIAPAESVNLLQQSLYIKSI